MTLDDVTEMIESTDFDGILFGDFRLYAANLKRILKSIDEIKKDFNDENGIIVSVDDALYNLHQMSDDEIKRRLLVDTTPYDNDEVYRIVNETIDEEKRKISSLIADIIKRLNDSAIVEIDDYAQTVDKIMSSISISEFIPGIILDVRRVDAKEGRIAARDIFFSEIYECTKNVLSGMDKSDINIDLRIFDDLREKSLELNNHISNVNKVVENKINECFTTGRDSFLSYSRITKDIDKIKNQFYDLYGELNRVLTSLDSILSNVYDERILSKLSAQNWFFNDIRKAFNEYALYERMVQSVSKNLSDVTFDYFLDEVGEFEPIWTDGYALSNNPNDPGVRITVHAPLDALVVFLIDDIEVGTSIISLEGVFDDLDISDMNLEEPEYRSPYDRGTLDAYVDVNAIDGQCFEISSVRSANQDKLSDPLIHCCVEFDPSFALENGITTVADLLEASSISHLKGSELDGKPDEMLIKAVNEGRR